MGVGFLVMGAIGYVVKLSTYTSQAYPPLRIETWRYPQDMLHSTRETRLTLGSVHIPVNNILVGGA